MARTPTPAAPATGNAPAPAAGAPQTTAEQPTPATAPVETKSKTDVGELIEVRVLLAFDDYEPNDVAHVTATELKVLERDGKVDPHPDAVAYVESL